MTQGKPEVSSRPIGPEESEDVNEDGHETRIFRNLYDKDKS